MKLKSHRFYSLGSDAKSSTTKAGLKKMDGGSFELKFASSSKKQTKDGTFKF